MRAAAHTMKTADTVTSTQPTIISHSGMVVMLQRSAMVRNDVVGKDRQDRRQRAVGRREEHDHEEERQREQHVERARDLLALPRFRHHAAHGDHHARQINAKVGTKNTPASGTCSTEW